MNEWYASSLDVIYAGSVLIDTGTPKLNKGSAPTGIRWRVSSDRNKMGNRPCLELSDK